MRFAYTNPRSKKAHIKNFRGQIEKLNQGLLGRQAPRGGPPPRRPMTWEHLPAPYRPPARVAANGAQKGLLIAPDAPAFAMSMRFFFDAAVWAAFFRRCFTVPSDAIPAASASLAIGSAALPMAFNAGTAIFNPLERRLPKKPVPYCTPGRVPPR